MIELINGKPSKAYSDLDFVAQKRSQYAHIKGWHGCLGHICITELDHDSVITGYGKHDRVVVHCPDSDNVLECRVDHVWQLGTPTEQQVLKVAKAWPNCVKGKFKLFATEKADDESSTWFYFKKC